MTPLAPPLVGGGEAVSAPEEEADPGFLFFRRTPAELLSDAAAWPPAEEERELEEAELPDGDDGDDAEIGSDDQGDDAATTSPEPEQQHLDDDSSREDSLWQLLSSAAATAKAEDFPGPRRRALRLQRSYTEWLRRARSGDFDERARAWVAAGLEMAEDDAAAAQRREAERADLLRREEHVRAYQGDHRVAPWRAYIEKKEAPLRRQRELADAFRAALRAEKVRLCDL